MNEWEDNISFVVFGAVYWPSSRVDYTERRKTERKNVSPLHHRATTERRSIKRKKNETVFKFYFWSMPQWMNEWEDKFCSFLSCGLRETSSVDYTDFEEARLREKRKMFQINITSPALHREKKY